MKNFSAQKFILMAGGVLLSILSIAAIVAVVAGISSTRSYQERNKTISVQGTGEVFVEPDIAEFSFTVREEADVVADAQASVSETIADITLRLAALDIDESDIKTQNYTSNPRYEWVQSNCTEFGGCDSERVLKGYELQQSINVIVRDLDKAGNVLSLLGDAGVDNLYGPNLRVEDTDESRITAREQAIEKARAEAKELARTLDVRLVKMIDFYEDNHGGHYPEPMYAARSMDMVTGFAMEEAAFAPQIPAGESRVSSTVHLTFKIK